MNAPKRALAGCALALCAAWPLGAWAQTSTDPAGKVDTGAPASLSDGEVRRVDLEAGKLTIRHGPIQHLDMPGMTMVFTARDKGLLQNVKVGDKIRFMAVHEGGSYVVTAIQPAR